MKPTRIEQWTGGGHRRRVLHGFWLVLLGLAPIAAADAPARQASAAADSNELRAGLRRLIEDARDRVFPSLVNIRLVTSQYYGGKEIKGQAVGSGTIISADGYVLTNQHVTNNGRRFRCTLADRQEITAELVGEDPLTDLAVLQLHLDELADPHAPLPVATLGDSSTVRVGDHVLAMGSPFALARSVTLGIVSNTERVFAGGLGVDDPEEMRLQRWQRTGLFTRWIQHDALIMRGNSGGPLVNLSGQIIGVNELGARSMGFAIPSNLAGEVYRALVEHQEVPRSWVGLSLKPIAKTGLDHGVLINSVVKGSPADAAGLEPGDLVVGIDGEDLTVRFWEEVPPLLKNLADRPIGSEIDLAYERDEMRHDVTVTTAKLEKDRGEERAFRAWGLTALEITPLIAREHRLDSTAGVLVSGVRSGGSAVLAKPALAGEDVIRRIDGEEVADLDDFIARYERVMEMEPLPEYLLVEYERKSKQYLTLLKPKPDKDEDPPPEVAKAWVGISVQPVLKKLAKRLALGDNVGFRITRVYPHTLAAEADLQVGDIVTHLNGKRVKPRREEDVGLLHRQIKKLDIDEQATLNLVRDGGPREVTLQLERTRITPDEARRDNNRDFEIVVREITFFDRVDNRWSADTVGVIVQHIESAGWAQLGGLRPDDLIQQINEFEVRDLTSYRQAMEAVAGQEPERVVFKVLRGIRTRFQYVEPDWSPSQNEEENGK